LRIPGFCGAEIWENTIDRGRSLNLFKELVEKLVSQNEPESAATVVRDYL
jgi:hypothetical protein